MSRTALALLCAALAACASGTEEPAAAAAADATPVVTPQPAAPAQPEGSSGRAAIADRTPPLLLLDRPLHGLWLTDEESVRVDGRAYAGSAPTESLKVGGAEVLLGPDGAFSADVPLVDGLNVLGLRIEAEDGGRAVEARAVHRGATWPPGATIPGALVVELRADFLDDDTPDLDDVAAGVEVALAEPSLTGGLDLPYETSVATVRPTDVRLPSSQVDLVPRVGVLMMRVILTDPGVSFHLDGAPGFESLTTDGSMGAERATLTLGLRLSVSDGAIAAEPQGVDVSVEGFRLTATELDELLDAAPDAIDAVRLLLEERLEEEMTERLGGLVAEMLSTLAFDFEIDALEPALQVRLDVADLAITDQSVRLVFDAAIATERAPDLPWSPSMGSLRTPSAAPPEGFGSAPLAVAVDDDLINQALFAYWHGGGLTGRVLTADELAENLEKLPDVFKPLDTVVVDARFPPVLVARPDEDGIAPEWTSDMAMGDVQVRVTTTDGRSFDTFSGFRTGVRLRPESATAVGLVYDHRPRFLDVHAVCHDAPSGVDPGSVAALIRLMIPPSLRRISDQAEPIVLPAAPVGEALGATFAGRRLIFTRFDVRRLGPDRHFLVIEGDPLLEEP